MQKGRAGWQGDECRPGVYQMQILIQIYESSRSVQLAKSHVNACRYMYHQSVVLDNEDEQSGDEPDGGIPATGISMNKKNSITQRLIRSLP